MPLGAPPASKTTSDFLGTSSPRLPLSADWLKRCSGLDIQQVDPEYWPVTW